MSRSRRLASYVARRTERRSTANARRSNATAIAKMLSAEYVWVVGRTPPRGEFEAQAAAVDAGYTACVPLSVEWDTRRGAGAGGTGAVLVPVVPCMVFVGTDGVTNGVFDRLGPDIAWSVDNRPGGLLVVSSDVLLEFVNRVGFNDAVNEPPAFVPGQTVKVVAGPFAGFTGTVLFVKGGLVRVDITVIGCRSSTYFRPSDLRKPS